MVTMDHAPTVEKSDLKRKITIASKEAFQPGTRMEVVVGKVSIAVFNLDGEYYAVFGRCPHQLAPLSRGRLQGTVLNNAETDWKTKWVHDGEVITCPGHAMEYHLKTGKAFGYDFRLRTYEVIVEDGLVKLLL